MRHRASSRFPRTVSSAPRSRAARSLSRFLTRARTLTPRFFNSGNTRPAYLPVAPTIRTLIYCSQDINERVLQECMRIQTTVLTTKQINDQRMLSDFCQFPVIANTREGKEFSKLLGAAAPRGEYIHQDAAGFLRFF